MEVRCAYIVCVEVEQRKGGKKEWKLGVLKLKFKKERKEEKKEWKLDVRFWFVLRLKEETK